MLSVHVYCVNLDVFFVSSGLFQSTIQQHSEVPAPKEKKDEKHLSSVIMWPCRVPNLDFVCAATWRTLLSHSWSALRWYSSSKLLTLLCHTYSYKHIFIVFHYIKYIYTKYMIFQQLCPALSTNTTITSKWEVTRLSKQLASWKPVGGTMHKSV